MLKENRTTLKEEKAETLDDLRRCIYRMVEGVRQKQFFFSVSDLQRLDPEFFEDNRNAVNHFKDALFHMLGSLQMRGVLSKEMSDQWKKDFIGVIMLSHIFWVRGAEKESTYTDLSLDDFVKSQIRLLEPYLVH